LDKNLHPYVVFLPGEQKTKILSAIFGSKASVDILKFSLTQGISNKIYQKELVKKLEYSNKTIIENLKSLTSLGVVEENMEKTDGKNRITWVKTYRLTDSGRWFALLLAEGRDLSESEKAEILQNLFRTYIRWVKDLSDRLKVDRIKLKKIFEEEMK
jgi:DNA-binding PadR family transcriptional regulator